MALTTASLSILPVFGQCLARYPFLSSHVCVQGTDQRIEGLTGMGVVSAMHATGNYLKSLKGLGILST
jgi:hypothetical protein